MDKQKGGEGEVGLVHLESQLKAIESILMLVFMSAYSPQLWSSERLQVRGSGSLHHDADEFTVQVFPVSDLSPWIAGPEFLHPALTCSWTGTLAMTVKIDRTSFHDHRY